MAVYSEHGVLLDQYRLLAWTTKNQHVVLVYIVVLQAHVGWPALVSAGGQRNCTSGLG
jgi:hypothetical protein